MSLEGMAGISRWAEEVSMKAPSQADLARLLGPPSHLPATAAERKAVPLARGLLDYFPDALVEVARLSQVGSDKHNPGEPLHWSRDKSSDHADCIMRHLIDRGTTDPEDGFLHDVKVAWRALALLQVALERARAEGQH